MKRADILNTDYKVSKNIFRINFTIDCEIESYISIKFPFNIEDCDKVLHDYLATACVMVLASLALPSKLNLAFPMPQKDNFIEVIKLLYDIRCYSEEIKFIDLPKINSHNCTSENIKFDPSGKTASLFWSGGLDSTYSYILLKKNGYDVNLIHSNINIDQFSAEKKSVENISKILNISPQFLYIDFPDMKLIGKRYSNKFSVFPHYNSIPFGRDIIHMFAGLFFNIKYNSRYLCLGHEYDLWKNYIYKSGKIIYRDDFQSEFGCLLIDKILKRINKKLHFFSPVAALSKFNIYHSLLGYNKEIFREINSCFFGYNCKICSNCLLYEILKNIAEGKTGSFVELKNILSIKDTTKDLTFAKIVYYYFYDSIQKNKINLKELMKEKFGNLSLSEDKILTLQQLNKINSVKLTPKDFKY